MREIDYIVVHASATNPNQDIGVKEIREWHTNPRFNEKTNRYRYLGEEYSFDALPENVKGKSGRGWRDIGYHHVIRRNGVLESGRELSIPGAHVKGHNKNSIGVCLVGGVDIYGNPVDNFTPEQKATLIGYLDTLFAIFQSATLKGHRDFSPDLNGDGIITPDEFMKQCPCFDVKELYYG